MIRRKVGDSMLFIGGAENTVRVSVVIFGSPGSMYDRDKTLRIESALDPKQAGIYLSPETMQKIIEWAEEE